MFFPTFSDEKFLLEMLESGLTFHRITEWFALEGTWKIISFQTPCHGQGTGHGTFLRKAVELL